MSEKFQLSCESTVDLPYSYVTSRDISVIFYTYTLNGEEYYDDMGRNPQALPDFYQKLAEGGLPTTSQINTFRYEEYFENLLQKGDVLHITLGTGMTASYTNACEAAERLRAKYPDRKLILVDSLGSSSGYGLLVDYAADLRDEGKSMEEIEAWLLATRNHVHHQFFSTDLTMFRRGGRVSGPAATVGTVLGLCPLMHLNCEGRIIAYSRVRGKRKAIAETAKAVMAHIQDGVNYRGKLFINHSRSPELVEGLKEALIPYLGDVAAKAPVFDIGTIIASHTGVGTVVAYFLGDERGEN